ncbi:MAG: hypothetical protein ACYC9S_10925 [Leptospirales bacterium]
MFDEPYRWVEAIGQRRDYIEDQIKRSTPVIVASVEEGIVFYTFYRRIPKIYEIYDRIAMGAIGHPADIESVRMMLLNAAHLEGYQRSPKDVTLNRLVLFSLSPRLKSSFEEVMSSPMLFRSVLAEVGSTIQKDRMMLVDYDGNVEESPGVMIAGGSASVKERVLGSFSSEVESGEKKDPTLQEMLPRFLNAYLKGVFDDEALGLDPAGNRIDEEKFRQSRKRLFSEGSPNVALLDRKKGSLVPVEVPVSEEWALK